MTDPGAPLVPRSRSVVLSLDNVVVCPEAEWGGALAAVVQPAITFPAQGATGVSRTPTLTSSAFVVSGGSDTHATSDWQVATDAGFTAITSQSLANAVSRTSWLVPVTLAALTVFHVRVRYNGTVLGASPWSAGVSFTTGA